MQTVADEERAEFMRLAGDDGEIDAYELQDILNREFKTRKISCSSAYRSFHLILSF